MCSSSIVSISRVTVSGWDKRRSHSHTGTHTMKNKRGGTKKEGHEETSGKKGLPD